MQPQSAIHVNILEASAKRERYRRPCYGSLHPPQPRLLRSLVNEVVPRNPTDMTVQSSDPNRIHGSQWLNFEKPVIITPNIDDSTTKAALTQIAR
jgi:hypothetical protein